MAKVKVLIVGGAGYIGSHVNLWMNQKGFETIIYDNLVYGHRELVQWGTFVQGDLANADQLRNVFSKYQITAVMHFAAYAYVGESVTEPEKYYLNNVANTLNLLKVMREFEVKNLVFSSTCATYGHPQQDKINENHIQEPINPYGQSKLMVEKFLSDYSQAYGLNFVALRYFNAAGADPQGLIGEWHEPETHLIPLVLNAASDNSEPIKIFGNDYDTIDGTCIRDYIHVLDIADAHYKALAYIFKYQQSNVFNLGNGNGFSVMDVIKTAEQVTGMKINYQFAERRDGDPARLVGDASKAGKILGWKPKFVLLKEIIQSAWDWELKKRSL